MGSMTEHPSNKSRMYVTNQDIIKLSSIGEDVVFAVTAPHGTTLVVPDPDEGVDQGKERRYRYGLTLASSPARPLATSVKEIKLLGKCIQSRIAGHSYGLFWLSSWTDEDLYFLSFFSKHPVRHVQQKIRGNSAVLLHCRQMPNQN